MADVVNTVGGVAGTTVGQQPTRVFADTTPKTADTAIKTLNAGSPTQASPLSARLFDDPLAGIVVSQQLDSQGQIVTQTPSSSVLAYLRNGLTIEGLPKQSTSA